MRSGVLAVALGAVVAGTACASSGAIAAKPALRIVGKTTLQGRDFRRLEVVRVTFTGPTVYRQRRVRAGAEGAFRAALPAYDPCNGPLVVVARGAAGDEAQLKLPKRGCLPIEPPPPS